MTPARRAAVGIVGIALWAGAMASAAAQAPTQLSPPAPQAPPPAAKPAAKPAPSKPQATPGKPAPAPAAPTTAVAPQRELDMAYGAFQRGYYLTAFSIATQRAEERKDIKAMALLGELYSNGLGVGRDDKKAAEWYQLAADRGDRE